MRCVTLTLKADPADAIRQMKRWEDLVARYKKKGYRYYTCAPIGCNWHRNTERWSFEFYRSKVEAPAWAKKT